MINFIKFVGKAPYNHKNIIEIKTQPRKIKYPSKKHTYISVQYLGIKDCIFDVKKNEKHMNFQCM